MYKNHFINIAELRDLRRQLRKNSTEAEKKLWTYLRGSKLGVRFYRQLSIGRYIPDFCCRSLRLIIEVDGDIHQDPDISENDKIRSDILEGVEYKILRFTNQEVLTNIFKVLSEIKKNLPPLPFVFCRERG